VLAERYLSGPGVVNGAVVDELLARTSSGGSTAWYLTDKLGSVRDIVSSSGGELDHIVYDSFGNIVTQTDAANGDRFAFAGMEYDSVTGRYYDRARDYDPLTGRFTTQDPAGFAGGSMNVYTYVGSDASDWTDYSGMYPDGPPQRPSGQGGGEDQPTREMQEGELIPGFGRGNRSIQDAIDAAIAARIKDVMQRTVDNPVTYPVSRARPQRHTNAPLPPSLSTVMKPAELIPLLLSGEARVANKTGYFRAVTNNKRMQRAVPVSGTTVPVKRGDRMIQAWDPKFLKTLRDAIDALNPPPPPQVPRNLIQQAGNPQQAGTGPNGGT
jgi:RHS repeat-associated protein